VAHETVVEAIEDPNYDILDNYVNEVDDNYVKVVDEAHKYLEEQQAVKEKDDTDLSKLVGMLAVPKVEIKTYYGEPKDYHSFVKLFDTSVVSMTDDGAMRLTRLLQYTGGEAYDLIKGCAVMDDSDDGYAEARARLKRRYGDNDIVAQKLIADIYDIRPVRSAKDLRKLADNLDNAYAVLKAMGRLREVESQHFIVTVYDKLQPYVKNKWRSRVMDVKEKTGEYPDFKRFCNFVSSQADASNDAFYGAESPSASTTKTESSSKGRRPAQHSTVLVTATVKCNCCNQSHCLSDCSMFKNKTLQDRFDLVHKERLCRLCFNPGHYSLNCKIGKRCITCNGKHNSLLHYTNQPLATVPVVSNVSNSGNNVCMPVLKLSVDGRDGVLVVLDSASTTSFISSKAARRLQLSGRRNTIQLETITGIAKKDTHMVDLTLVSEFDTASLKGVNIVDKIPVNTGVIHISRYEHLTGLPLYDHAVSEVDVLIGQDHGHLMLPLNSRFGGPNEPYAVQYPLGWALGGLIHDHANGDGLVRHTSNLIHVSATSPSLFETDMEKLWHIEQGDDERLVSQDDEYVQSLWNDNTVLSEGRYEIPIPVRPGAVFHDNKSASLHRLQSLKRSLTKKDLYTRYEEGIVDLINKGYAEEVPLVDRDKPGSTWYLPHHAVISDKKPDKLRIVFDCAAKYRGESINDKCLQGPDVVNKLVDVLLRFREHKYAITADVKDMYYQVLIPADQRDLLRFLWYRDGQVMTYRMKCHVFGGIWCASSSTHALRRVVTDDPDVTELVKNTILHSFYVDDCLVSAPDESTIRSVWLDVSAQLAKGGFELTKFQANCDVIYEIPEADRAKDVKSLCESTKVLGIQWDLQNDNFWFQSDKVYDAESVTRRGMLSVIASTYDPLGLAGPILVVGRLIFQEATRLKLAWDDSVGHELTSKWLRWIGSLEALSLIKVPRCLKVDDPSSVVMELHHFSDTSQVAYGSCTYLRSVNRSGVVSFNLVMSKSRVAPLKSVTIPRLELQAAVLSVSLDRVVRNAMSLELGESYFWTDSRIVLGYISNSQKRFPVYVSNRISKIRAHSSADQWHHVGGTHNPADIISRGSSADQLDRDMWFNGPKFVYENESEWNLDPVVCDSDEEEVEELVSVNVVDASVLEHPVDLIARHYSSWLKMKRALAWLRRLVSKIKVKDGLTAAELDAAEVVLIGRAQLLHYQKDIEVLRSGHNVRKLCDLRALSPYIDDDGLVHVGGRLAHANIGNEHPIVVPFQHPISKAIVLDVHNASHLGKEWVLSIVRAKYWIVKARPVIKRVIGECVMCKRMYSYPCKQMMANLPPDRVKTMEAPFTRVGIDMFGPFLVKVNRSEVKRWVCLYTCMSTRAVHLEKTVSLDTNSFINSFRRFQSRRGKPESVYSDNGTNFVGAEAEMKRAKEEISEVVIAKFAADNGINWKFNPPTASHMGGVWERMIRTVRRVMFAVMQGGLTDEILDTALCEVECIINGRPLTKLSDDPQDPTPLTPNHLLMLKGNCELPPGVFSQADVYRRRWRHVQLIADNFWKKFVRFYLPELQKRVKWTQIHPNLKVGDLVMMMDTLQPRNYWPLALVQEVNVGRDDLVRSVRLKSASGTYVRPIHKVVLLEASSHDKLDY
jgi:hypothetical protein